MPPETTERRWTAILQLMRLPNVFTAVADVAMGYLVTHGSLQPAGIFAMLVAASCSLYLAGMVLNDVFDIEADTRDSPNRPIPSGRVPLATATALGWGLLSFGVLLGWLVGYLAGDWRPGIVASLLAACVVLYDWTLKRTPFAPLLMGACRMFNVLLGMSLARQAKLVSEVTSPPTARLLNGAEWMIAIGIGVYIVGVTFFARTEARDSSRARLFLGTLVMLGGMGLLASVPRWLSQAGPQQLLITERGWYLLWAAIALLIVWRCFAAVIRPLPLRVQMAVRNAVQLIIVLDAAICVGLAGTFWGICLLLLLLPTALLTQWLKAT